MNIDTGSYIVTIIISLIFGWLLGLITLNNWNIKNKQDEVKK